jgi:hypothetical protein
MKIKELSESIDMMVMSLMLLKGDIAKIQEESPKREGRRKEEKNDKPEDKKKRRKKKLPPVYTAERKKPGRKPKAPQA